MNRQEKTQEIELLKEKFTKAQIAILTDYKGLSVESFNELRGKLRESGSEIKVIKNRLAKIAVKDTNFEFLSEHLKGTTALTVSETDPVAPAKVIVDFAKDSDFVSLKAAGMSAKEITKSELEALAKLPSREELIGSLLGSMMAPARNLVSVMAQIPRQLVNVLAAVRDQKEKGE